MLAQVTELRTALQSEKREREGAEAELAERLQRAEREAAVAASEAAAAAEGLRRELERTMEVGSNAVISSYSDNITRERIKLLT